MPTTNVSHAAKGVLSEMHRPQLADGPIWRRWFEAIKSLQWSDASRWLRYFGVVSICLALMLMQSCGITILIEEPLDVEALRAKDGSFSESFVDAPREGAFERTLESPRDTASEHHPESALEPAFESIPEPHPDTTPERRPENTPEPYPDATPERRPERVLERWPESPPESVPETPCVSGQSRPCLSGRGGCVRSGGAYLCKGECKTGAQSCQGGVWSACIGEVTSTTETCDGKDNDCNGLIDDGLGMKTCGLGECRHSVDACANGNPQTCTPKSPPSTTELCNGKDDNCDGSIDEGCSSCTISVLAFTISSPGYVYSVAYAPDGKTLASASADKTIKIWDAATGTLLRTLTGHSFDVTSVAYSPDGKTLASASSDSTINLWECPCAAGATRACFGSERGCVRQADGTFACKGPCKIGTRTCDTSGTFGACVGDVLPQADKLDGIDNDCDGTIDNGNYVDLQSTSITLSNTTVKVGDSATMTLCAANKGQGNSGPFVARLYFAQSAHKIPAQAMALTGGPNQPADLAFPSLASGAADACKQITVIIPWAMPGTFLIVAWLDFGNAVSESNEANNVATVSITIQ